MKIQLKALILSIRSKVIKLNLIKIRIILLLKINNKKTHLLNKMKLTKEKMILTK